MERTTNKTTLEIALGQHSLTGRRKRNEDFYGCITPEGETLRHKGIAVVLADGVGGERGGREAAEYAVKSFLFDYYSTPDTWSVRKSVDQVLSSINRWIYHEGRRLGQVRHMATTFSALILKGTRYTAAHVGDSRIYLLRDGALRLLTADHRWEGKDLGNVLTRGIGLDVHLHLDFTEDEVRVGDRFFFCSDGVSDWVPDDRLHRMLAEEKDPQSACERITRLALEMGSLDNVTCQVVRVDALPPEEFEEVGEGKEALPFPGKIRPGMTLDDFEMVEVVHSGRMSTLWKGNDLRTGRTVALKFPNPLYEEDREYVERFLREEWAGKRLHGPWTVRVLPQPPGRRSCLYYVMEFHEGETLRRRLERLGRLSVAEAVEIAIHLCKGLAEMHRLQIVHRDVKPENIFLTRDHGIKILDLGVIRVEGLKPLHRVEEKTVPPGSPGYMAPELYRGDPGTPQSDLFAVGVTLYEILTGRLPYGEIEPFSRPVFREWTPATRYNPEIPLWLEAVMKKALDRDPEKRYEATTALLYDLEHPERVSLFGIRESLVDRDPVLFWKVGFLIMSGIALVLAVWLGMTNGR